MLVGIYVAADRGRPMLNVPTCAALAGVGLRGDRYSTQSGTWSRWPQDHELTLIEEETVATLKNQGLSLEAGQLRRNLVTRGVNLADFLNREFTMGPVRCRGTRTCDPCGYLERCVGVPGLLAALGNWGGIRAVILESNVVREGDLIELLPV